MDILHIAALLIVLAGLFGAFNYLVLKLPQAIGILIVALAASLAVMAIGALVPGAGLTDTIRASVLEIEFADALLEIMLGLLLFAGALHVRVEDLRAEWPVVLSVATLGIGISVLVAGGAAWAVTGMPILVALTFGAIVSPTDPVAVLGVLKAAKLPPSLQTRIAGESLFNDGVGYVAFLILAGLAFPAADAHGAAAGHGGGAAAGALRLFLQEAVGGAALGLVLGWLTFRLMRLIDDYALEVLLTLGLAFGGYVAAGLLHVSGPIVAVSAGLLIGDVGARRGMSERTRDYVDLFWKLVDEILNAVLFLMIGVEVFAIALDRDSALFYVLAVPIALVARFAAVAIPIQALRAFRTYDPGVIRVMTWGGLKGGISVALALSLPDTEWTPAILTATYLIVIFSIIVQGLTVAPVARRVVKTDPPDITPRRRRTDDGAGST